MIRVLLQLAEQQRHDCRTQCDDRSVGRVLNMRGRRRQSGDFGVPFGDQLRKVRSRSAPGGVWDCISRFGGVRCLGHVSLPINWKHLWVTALELFGARSTRWMALYLRSVTWRWLILRARSSATVDQTTGSRSQADAG